MKLKHLIGYGLTAIVALGAGAAAGAGSSSSASASGPVPTKTVTASAGTTATKTVPGPTVTETVTKRPPAKVRTKTVKVTPTAKASFPGDGTYQVGVDIKPGTYISAPPSSGNCYWARLNDSGSFDIIANNNSAGQSLVTIAATDKFFETSGCSEWQMR